VGHEAHRRDSGRDPLTDVKVLESVSFVMKAGAVVRSDTASK
jgi:hypothetical protein